ncbi:hypothetical protein EW146_g7024 [Bondarzewia mesenterica]|uniref:peptidyl-tRNA hydrolase n=1 Tax=Bondarzewia mesenterica TaxID=1095465 RepID=A0A4V3XEC6_9AGAM|nr:hypothetical protein EW146_g7024 [Bondarzewia mesenterica]
MNKTLRGYFAETKATIGEKSVEIAFFKPEALMNITGPPTAEALRKTVRSPSSLIVIHDSLEHQPASLSPKFGGSASGHNGIRSVISAVGTRDFHRLRIGIGRSTYVASYVLGRLNSHERQYWSQNGEGIDKVWEQIEKIAMQNGVAR